MKEENNGVRKGLRMPNKREAIPRGLSSEGKSRERRTGPW
ncbi:hypothetical protein E2C01_048317 [Portunus trituberculatus]|uniref:Uncharacterized protein n=1 Tax=Portunus trituberculatus TaxID=210409 RepID=A0A5B7G3H1_PORTR|nr:hypothetical protein [Portunus trituberculatus]